MGRKKTTDGNQLPQTAPPAPQPVAPVARRTRRTAAAVEADEAKARRIREIQAAIMEAQQFVALHSEARAQAERNVRASKKKVAELQTELVKLMMPF